MPVLPVFLSSTFSDFQGERDILIGPVRERLDEILLPLGCRVEMIDLRWGVDTTTVDERDAYRLVLEVCLDEVERARPLFLGLVGGRYGDVPDPAQVRWVLKRPGVYDSESLVGLSISAMEMGYGGLWRNVPVDGQVFLLRDIAGAHGPRWVDPDPTRVAELRSVIKSAEENGRCTVVQYQARLVGNKVDLTTIHAMDITQSFEDVAYELLLPVVLRHAEELISHTAEGVVTRLELFQQDRRILAGRDEAVVSFVHKLENGCRVLLEGESGSGKSTLLLAVSERLQEQAVPCATFVAGLGPADRDEAVAIRVLASQVNKFLREPIPIPQRKEQLQQLVKWWQSFLESAVQELDSLVLLVDALEQLPQTDGSEPTFLSVIPPHVSVLVSSARPGEVRWLGVAGFEFASLGPLSSPVVREALEAWARASGGRTLPKEPLRILSSGERFPIWVRMAIDWLVGLGGDDFAQVDPEVSPGLAISNLLETEAMKLPNDATELAARLLARTAERVGKSTAKLLLAWLSTSRSGLVSADLVAMLSRYSDLVNGVELTVARLKRALGSQLVTVDRTGRLAFSHALMREAASRNVTWETHRQIAEYLMELPIVDDVGRLDIVWHLLMSFQSHLGVTSEQTSQLAKVLRNTPPSSDLGEVILSAVSDHPISVQFICELKVEELGLDGVAALNSINLVGSPHVFEPARVIVTCFVADLAEQVTTLLSEWDPLAQRVQNMLLDELLTGVRESVEVERKFIPGRMAIELCIAHDEAGRAALDNRDLKTAQWHFERGLNLVQLGFAQNSDMVKDLSIDFHLGIGSVHEASQEFGAAAQSYERAVTLGRSVVMRFHHTSFRRELSVSLDALARVKVSQGLLQEATALFEEGLGLIDELRIENGRSILLERDYSISLDNLARLSWQMGKIDLARRRYTEALGIAQRLSEWQPNDVEAQLDLVDAYFNLASFEESCGQTDIAIAHLMGAVDAIHIWTFVAPSLRLFCSYGSLLLKLAELRTSRGDGRLVLDILARALRMHKQAVELTDDISVSLQLARTSLKFAVHLSQFCLKSISPERHFKQALQVLAEILRKRPDWKDANLLVIEAVTQYIHACEMHSHERVTLLLLSRNMHYRAAGDHWSVNLLQSLYVVDRELLEYRDLLGSKADTIEVEIISVEAALRRHGQ